MQSLGRKKLHVRFADTRDILFVRKDVGIDAESKSMPLNPGAAAERAIRESVGRDYSHDALLERVKWHLDMLF